MLILLIVADDRSTRAPSLPVRKESARAMPLRYQKNNTREKISQCGGSHTAGAEAQWAGARSATSLML